MNNEQHIPVESDREEVRDWVLSVCMDAKIDQALPPEKEAGGTLYQVREPNAFLFSLSALGMCSDHGECREKVVSLSSLRVYPPDCSYRFLFLHFFVLEAPYFSICMSLGVWSSMLNVIRNASRFVPHCHIPEQNRMCFVSESLCLEDSLLPSHIKRFTYTERCASMEPSLVGTSRHVHASKALALPFGGSVHVLTAPPRPFSPHAVYM